MEYLATIRSDAASFDISSLQVEPCGVWINETNGHTRLALTRDGRYSKQQGLRQGAYSGRYACQGTRIRFIDDFDFVVTGEISGNILRVGDFTYRRG